MGNSGQRHRALFLPGEKAVEVCGYTEILCRHKGYDRPDFRQKADELLFCAHQELLRRTADRETQNLLKAVFPGKHHGSPGISGGIRRGKSFIQGAAVCRRKQQRVCFPIGIGQLHQDLAAVFQAPHTPQGNRHIVPEHPDGIRGTIPDIQPIGLQKIDAVRISGNARHAQGIRRKAERAGFFQSFAQHPDFPGGAVIEPQAVAIGMHGDAAVNAAGEPQALSGVQAVSLSVGGQQVCAPGV